MPGTEMKPETLPMITSTPRRGDQGGVSGVEGAEHAEQVRLELAAHVGQGQLGHDAGEAEAGVGHRHIEAAKLGQGAGHGFFLIAVTGDVGGDAQDPRPLAAKLGGELLQAVQASGGEHEVGPPLRQLARQRRADSRGSSGDEDNLAVQSHGRKS